VIGVVALIGEWGRDLRQSAQSPQGLVTFFLNEKSNQKNASARPAGS
jgi:hypothetical protein